MPQGTAGKPGRGISEAPLRIYGHPRLLAVAMAVNGGDFVPFNEVLFIKGPVRTSLPVLPTS